MNLYKLFSVTAVVVLLPALSIIQTRASGSVTESLPLDTKAPEQVFVSAGENDGFPVCMRMTQCEERMGCDPDSMLPYSAPIPRGYFVGCSAALQDDTGKVWYFNFIDDQWLTERTVDGVTIGNMNPHTVGAPVTIKIDESLTGVDFTLLHISYMPWPDDSIPCNAEREYQCATVTPHVYDIPIIYQP